MSHMTRRRMIASATTLIGLTSLTGCNSKRTATQSMLTRAEAVTRTAQRLIMPHDALAREFSELDISPNFRANGTVSPDDGEYIQLAASAFQNWRLEIGGLVEKSLRLSLSDLRSLPSRTQITRHDCVEGWSCIGKWTGAPLHQILRMAGLKPAAKYIVFYCADSLGLSLDRSNRYYESIDLIDAFHPQTILAYDMNGAPLSVAHGAPLRVRVERQLGYKMAKYITRIEAVESYEGIAGGHGSFWADRGYEWYAGI